MAVHAVSDRLAAVFNVAFDHDAFNERIDLGEEASAVENFLDNPWLLIPLLSGVRVVGIHDDSRVRKAEFFIHISNSCQIFIVVIRHIVAVLVDRAAEDRMGQRISAVEESGGRARCAAELPEDGKGLYKGYLCGTGGRALLGT